MNSKVLLIRNVSSISPLGSSGVEVWDSYSNAKTLISDSEVDGKAVPAARLSESSEEIIQKLIAERAEYKKLDRAVQMALAAGRGLLDAALLQDLIGKRIFVNIGSSRGATGVFEKAHQSYLEKGSVPVLTSPTSTLGNLSSWLMQDLKLKGINLSTSVTCSTALQAICNAYAWLNSDMADFAIVGASEAPLTGFTLSQMEALRIYADLGLNFPCMPCAETYEKGCGMVLGEGSALFLLEKKDPSELRSGDIYIESFGYSSEPLTSATSISSEADCIYEAMKMAEAEMKPDVLLMHAPGTEQGDRSEINAAIKLFDAGTLPVIASNKWLIGHTFGAAGAFNLEYAVHILKNQKFIDFPYPSKFNNKSTKRINRVMLNAAGFGGNATSLLVACKD